VLFSCKITHSVITFLDKRGEDLEALYDRCDWPAEFLRDSSSWLEADKMENLLKQIDTDYGRGPQSDENLMLAAGHQSKDLRAWGVLDSVLRMVQTPKDLFAQPERFLSYFISPAPPVGEVKRAHDSVSFVLPVSEMQFPYVTTYLRAALEALPTYIAKPMASVTWDNSRVSITWSENQVSLFGEAQATDISLHPELVSSILSNLESSQKDLEDVKRTLFARDQEIEILREQLAKASSVPTISIGQKPEPKNLGLHPTQSSDARLGDILHEMYRLGDYFARGQQLMTLLIGQGRQTSQVQEAMRRVDWDFVSTEGPQLVRRVVTELQQMQEHKDIHQPSVLRGEGQPLGEQVVLDFASKQKDAAL
jgi:hypothetical protein